MLMPGVARQPATAKASSNALSPDAGPHEVIVNHGGDETLEEQLFRESGERSRKWEMSFQGDEAGSGQENASVFVS